MIDLHCHYIPEIDDGARDLNSAIALAQYAEQSGISHAVCTPHIDPGHYENDINSINKAHVAYASALREVGCNLKTACAAEVRICPEIVQWVKQKKIPYVGSWKGKPVILLEFPHSHIPVGTTQLLAWLQKHDVQVMVAHPERNRDVWGDITKLKTLKKYGCIFQVTSGSFLNRFSNRAKQIAEIMLHEKLIAVVASDAHSLRRRPPDLKEGYEAVSTLSSPLMAEILFKHNPWQIAESLFDAS